MTSKQQNETNQVETAKLQRPSIFGVKKSQEILVPPFPICLRNNCQSGRWVNGEIEYQSSPKMNIIKLNSYYGSFGKTDDELFAQLWFFIEDSDEFPNDVVFVTYIKSRSLTAFNALLTSIQAQQIDPGWGTFIPKFVKHGGNKINEMTGEMMTTNYYSLSWTWQPHPEDYDYSKYDTLFDDPDKMALLNDVDSTKALICIDGMSPQELEQIRAANKHFKYGGALPQNQDRSLKGVDVPSLPAELV